MSQIEETEETSEVDLDDLQMDETEDPFAEELDNLVLNIITRKCNSSVAQLNREQFAENKDSRYKKRQQFEESSPHKN
ncbi:Os02g0138700 [Oryza sativa Japonica Group]|uniref:Os02g0138700 protein n=6 Tax=Oryza TaxID=4527 RepID=A0A0P0VES1_ORYSJ|nr:hypothetical protein OsI_05782 [Oryza sativa Indica Group]EAZ21682.1 hypothetical protein OsJ_05312 [Oryza sativa Japonica Group]BAD10538.1 hypothetical protein [Oryza sativa Japonica Group]BAS76896.1 Os02g0138700 [Oryza sativa Japonica Group]